MDLDTSFRSFFDQGIELISPRPLPHILWFRIGIKDAMGIHLLTRSSLVIPFPQRRQSQLTQGDATWQELSSPKNQGNPPGWVMRISVEVDPELGIKPVPFTYDVPGAASQATGRTM